MAEPIPEFERAMAVNPADENARRNLEGSPDAFAKTVACDGYPLANAGRMAEAIPEFERAVALNPADENARRNLEGARQVLSRRR